MFVKTFSRFFLIGLLFAGVPMARATVSFSSLFSNNMILQRSVSVHVWGTASEGEGVTVSFNGSTLTTVGDASSAWSLLLAPMSALTTGTTLSVTGPSNGVTYSNVVVGDIYLCSGQSNMDSVALNASTPNGATDAANSNYPNIRMLHVNRDIQAAPVSDTAFAPGVWRTCVSSTNASFISNFSGMGYYFGRMIYESQGGAVPIGLIHSAYYGMPAEAFMSLEAILSDPAMSLAIPASPFSTAYNDGYPTGVYNAIIAPLTKFNIAGAVWNQGESNQSNINSGTSPHGWLPSTEYKTVLPALIKDWRVKWNSNFPFYIIQMPNIGNLNSNVSPCTYWGGIEPWNCVESGLADVRWGELNTLKMPRTGMSVNFDLNAGANDCDANISYHPKNKEEFTKRIVPWAVNQIYGAGVPYTFTGPLYRSYEVVGSSVVVHFDLPNGGSGFSTSNGQPVTGFQISSSTSPENYVWATAVTSTGDSVTVSATSIASPRHVRYAWANNPVDSMGPVANLTDAQGYLASPFRTYDFSDMLVTGAGGATIPDLNLTPSLTDGTDLGAMGLCQAATVTYTIRNASTATAPLTLTGGTTLVRVSGTNASDFFVETQPPVSILAPGSSTSFQLSFLPGSTGLRQAILRIPCNTPHKTPYTIYLQATGYDNCTPTFTPTGTWYTSTPTVTKTPTMTMTPTMTPAWSVTLIDNFDDTGRGAAATRLNLWGQAWGAYGGNGSTINAAYFSPGANGSSNAVSVYGNNPANGYCNYLSNLMASQAIFDAASAGFTGIQFWILGDGGQIRAQLTTSDVTTGDFYGYTFAPPAGTWSHVLIPFSSMTQAGWGRQPALPTNPTGVNATGVKFDVISNDTFAFLLDELTFYGPLPTATPTGTWHTATFTPTQTQTPTVTPPPRPTGTWFTSPPPATNLPDNSKYPFESANPFTYSGNAVTGASLSTAKPYLGNGSLAVTFGTTYPYGDIGIEPVSLSIAGGGVTAHVWVPGDLPANSTAFFYLKSGTSWCWQVSASVTLTPGAWNTVIATESNLSSATCGPNPSHIQGLGLRLQASSTWSGVFYLDSVDIGGGGTATPTLTPTASPTATWTPTGTWHTVTPTATLAGDTATYHFESAQQGWTYIYSDVSGVSRTTTDAYWGSACLAVTYAYSVGEGQVGIESGTLAANATGGITARIKVPSGIPAGTTAHLFIKSSSWGWFVGPDVTLTAGAWETLTLTAANVSAGGAAELGNLNAIGIQLVLPSTWSGVFFVDSVDVVGGSTTPTMTPTLTPTLSATSTPSVTFTPSATLSATWTSTLLPGDTATFTATPTRTATVTPTATITHTRTATRTFTVTATATQTATRTPTMVGTATWTGTPTATPTITNTFVPNLDVPFPNPSEGSTKVTFGHLLEEDMIDLVIKVFTVSGRKVFQQSYAGGSGGGVFGPSPGVVATAPGRGLSAGLHFYTLDWGSAGISLSNGLYYLVLQEKGGKNKKTTMRLLVNR